MTFVQSLRHMGVAGWLATVAAVAFCVQVFLFVDHRAHSVTDTLYGVFPYWVPTFLLWAWLVEHLGRRPPA